FAYAVPVAAANALPQPVQRRPRTPKFASAHARTTAAGRTFGLPRQSGSAPGATATAAPALPAATAAAAIGARRIRSGISTTMLPAARTAARVWPGPA